MKGNYPTLLLMAGALCIAFLCGYSLGDRPASAPPAEYVYWEDEPSALETDPTETSEPTEQGGPADSPFPAGQSDGKASPDKNNTSSSTNRKPSSSASSKIYLSSTTSEREGDKSSSDKSDRPASHEEVKPDPNAIVNINTADLDELCTLDGIGPVLAQRIIDFRSHAGGFAYVEELLSVSGIGEKKFDAIRDRVTV